MDNTIIDGNKLFVFIGASAVAYSTSYTLTLTRDNKPIASKDVGAQVERNKGRMTITASTESLMDFAGIQPLLTAMDNRTTITVAFGEKTALGSALDSNKTTASGTFLLTSLTLNAPDDENATYTAEFQCTGSFTYSAK